MTDLKHFTPELLAACLKFQNDTAKPSMKTSLVIYVIWNQGKRKRHGIIRGYGVDDQDRPACMVETWDDGFGSFEWIPVTRLRIVPPPPSSLQRDAQNQNERGQGADGGGDDYG